MLNLFNANHDFTRSLNWATKYMPSGSPSMSVCLLHRCLPLMYKYRPGSLLSYRAPTACADPGDPPVPHALLPHKLDALHDSEITVDVLSHPGGQLLCGVQLISHGRQLPCRFTPQGHPSPPPPPAQLLAKAIYPPGHEPTQLAPLQAIVTPAPVSHHWVQEQVPTSPGPQEPPSSGSH